MKMRFEPHLSSCAFHIQCYVPGCYHSNTANNFQNEEFFSNKKKTNENKILTHRIEKFIKTYQIDLSNTCTSPQLFAIVSNLYRSSSKIQINYSNRQQGKIKEAAVERTNREKRRKKMADVTVHRYFVCHEHHKI